MSPRLAFLRACALDVAVRKPGNVSLASAGHGMQAQQFITSAEAAVGALCQPGAPVGARIESAVEATWQAVGCNTNLGILLLCAPLALAAERPGLALRPALQQVLADLSVDDAQAAYRAIARAQPGGLGRVEEHDVHNPPRIGLRQAMAVAADRDRIAAQYRDDFAEIFDLGLPALGARTESKAETEAAVQRLFLAWLASAPDSHIVRKQGQAVAQIVMTAAQGWLARAQAGEPLDADPAFVAWDEALKQSRVNPGTSADLTVATLMVAGLLAQAPQPVQARAQPLS